MTVPGSSTRPRIPEPLRRAVLAWTVRWPAEAVAAWLAENGLLAAADDEGFSTEVRSLLRPSVEQTEATNRWLVWKFQDIVDALHPMPVCALKGIALLDTVYGGWLGARPMLDIDLLVRPGDIDHAMTRLRDDLGLIETALSARVREHAPHRVLTAGALKVELHRSLSETYAERAAWPRVRPVASRLHDRAVHTLDAETLLVHLAVHLVTHVPFSKLKWVADLLLAAARPHDPERALERARELGAATPLRAANEIVAYVLEDAGPIALAAPTRRERLIVESHRRLVWRGFEPGRLDAGSTASSTGRFMTSLMLSDSLLGIARTASAKVRELLAR